MNDPVIIDREQQIFSLRPTNLTEAMEYAKIIASSDLVPVAYKGKPGNVLIAVQMGMELGLSPFAAVQNIATINGRPSIYGDVGKALLLSHGCMIEEDDAPAIKSQGFARCRITRPNGAVTERTFSVEDAKRAKLWGKPGPWTEYTERQMAWRAFWFAARDGAADYLHGVAGAEETADYLDGEATEVPFKPKPAEGVVAAMREEIKQAQPGGSEPLPVDRIKKHLAAGDAVRLKETVEGLDPAKKVAVWKELSLSQREQAKKLIEPALAVGGGA